MANKVSDVLGKKHGRFSVRAIILIVIGVGLLTVFALGRYMSAGDITNCVAPEGFEVVKKQDATSPETGEPIHIVRGIVSTGIPMLGSKQVTVPACGSNDPDVTNVTNKYVSYGDPAKVRLLVSGAITYGSAPLAASTQP